MEFDEVTQTIRKIIKPERIGIRYTKRIGFSLVLLAGCGRPDSKEIDLIIGATHIRAELAFTPEVRQRGLMFRKDIPENGGMLFVFPEKVRHCMWMTNTIMPLSVAFLDDEGKVLNIAEMEPGNQRLHCSEGNVRYALEMHANWFSKHGVAKGGVFQVWQPPRHPNDQKT